MIKLDSCSLIYALKMDFARVLAKIHDEIAITRAVHDEVVTKGKLRGKPEAYICEKMENNGEIVIHDITQSGLQLGLGPGETTTIQNAIDNNCACLIDEKKGSRIARNLNIDVRNISITMLEALKMEIITDSEFDDFYARWVKYALPSPEDMYFVKAVKELVK